MTKVAATNTNNEWVTLWESENGPTVIQNSRIFTPDIQVSGAWISILIDTVQLKS